MDPQLAVQAITHYVIGMLRSLGTPMSVDDQQSDRGAVSLEQVLWFAAAGVAVAAVAAIVWAKVRNAANAPVNSPGAP